MLWRKTPSCWAQPADNNVEEFIISKVDKKFQNISKKIRMKITAVCKIILQDIVLRVWLLKIPRSVQIMPTLLRKHVFINVSKLTIETSEDTHNIKDCAHLKDFSWPYILFCKAFPMDCHLRPNPPPGLFDSNFQRSRGRDWVRINLKTRIRRSKKN